MAARRAAERMFTIPEVAELNRQSRATVYRRIAAGELRVVNLGTKKRTKMRIPESALADYQGAA